MLRRTIAPQNTPNRFPKEMQMYVTPEQIQATTKANVDAILSLASTQFAAIEKFASLNANAVKSAFEDSLSNVRALAGAKDAQEL
ncbi:MAG: phasin family protein, partial [Burkholderiales bacterium]